MKKVFLIAVLVMVMGLAGCTPFHGSYSNYKEGKWWLWADNKDAQQWESQQLAYEKLKGQPIQTATVNGVPQGYKGVVVNLNNYNRYNFQCKGPETKSYYLGPGQREVDYLLPGIYSCEVFIGGDRVGGTTFSVGPQTKKFLGEEYHWYVFAEKQ